MLENMQKNINKNDEITKQHGERSYFCIIAIFLITLHIPWGAHTSLTGNCSNLWNL